MIYEAIRYEKKHGIAYLILNRPHVGNAINPQMASELRDACQQVNEDPDLRVVIITGAGDSFFCSGDDLADSPFSASGSVAPSLGELEERSPASIASTSVASLHSPVIAAVNGDALGAGLELALSCDIRIASENCHFGLPNTSLGLIPVGGGTQLLPRIVGQARALELILTADPIDAQEAYRVGLVNKVVPKKELIAQAGELARGMLSRGPIAVRYAKEAINKGLDMTLEQGLRLEADLNIILQTTQDRAEGIRAFLERRAPQFKGK